MFWVWSLIVMGIAVGATGEDFRLEQRQNGKPEARPADPTVPTTSTTPDALTEMDKEITDQLQQIISKYQSECNDNSELAKQVDSLRAIAKLDKNSLVAKLNAKNAFQTFNEQRLSLEKQINDRIEAINDILPTLEPNSSCSRFYLKQREDLKKAKSLSNESKSKTLLANSSSCTPIETYDEDLDY
ncbi:uncharacterized protein LOC108107940 [Drosophila eugracilis]|uniref:uncharacterized protein LOC108107940 n=1 Tax=Drosophila eugracilis TaxID=29029 RepID=UPI0007E82E98|nr:uncharacterized protein LOC108107940 [Drosophila eugracilis]